MGSQFMFIVVMLVVRAEQVVPPEMMTPSLPYVFAAVAVMVAVASFIVPRQLLRAALQRINFEVTEVADPDAIGMYREAAEKVRVFKEPDRILPRSLGAYQTATILSLAMSEAISILGLALGLQGFIVMVTVPFFSAGILLSALRFPRESQLITIAEKLYDVAT